MSTLSWRLTESWYFDDRRVKNSVLNTVSRTLSYSPGIWRIMKSSWSGLETKIEINRIREMINWNWNIVNIGTGRYASLLSYPSFGVSRNTLPSSWRWKAGGGGCVMRHPMQGCGGHQRERGMPLVCSIIDCRDWTYLNCTYLSDTDPMLFISSFRFTTS